MSHAGLTERYQGRASGRVREFCLYGQTTGETDEYGLPVRYPWAQEYRGEAMVLYGHTPVPAPEWINNTLCLDTGCVFGGRLTALRYPERELVSVPAAEVYYEPARPFPVNPEAAVSDGGGPPRPGSARHHRRHRHPGHRDPVPEAHRGAGGERGRRAGGDEPVRDRPALAAVPAADDEPRRDLDPAGPARASRPGLRVLPRPRASTRSCARRSTWARARSCSSAATAAAARARFGTPGEQAGAVWTRTGRAFFSGALTAELTGPAAHRGRGRPGCSTSWTPRGCCSTPS